MHWRSLPIAKMHGGSLRDKRREEASAGILEKIEHEFEAVLTHVIRIRHIGERMAGEVVGHSLDFS